MALSIAEEPDHDSLQRQCLFFIVSGRADLRFSRGE